MSDEDQAADLAAAVVALAKLPAGRRDGPPPDGE